MYYSECNTTLQMLLWPQVLDLLIINVSLTSDQERVANNPNHQFLTLVLLQLVSFIIS